MAFDFLREVKWRGRFFRNLHLFNIVRQTMKRFETFLKSKGFYYICADNIIDRQNREIYRCD